MAFANPNAGIGAKRLVVGAHFGVGNFLLQRLTALILVVFVAILAVRCSPLARSTTSPGRGSSCRSG